MIARSWRGATRPEDADEYLGYMHRTGFAEYQATPGNRGVLALRRMVDGKTELLLVSFWDSLEAVRAFAGPDIERAVFYPEDDRFLIERDLGVTHYEVAFQAARAPSGADRA